MSTWRSAAARAGVSHCSMPLRSASTVTWSRRRTRARRGRTYPAQPDNEYGWEKLYSERVALAFGRRHGMAVRIGRFENCYGPEGPWRGGRERRHRPPSVEKWPRPPTPVRSSSGVTARPFVLSSTWMTWSTASSRWPGRTWRVRRTSGPRRTSRSMNWHPHGCRYRGQDAPTRTHRGPGGGSIPKLQPRPDAQPGVAASPQPAPGFGADVSVGRRASGTYRDQRGMSAPASYGCTDFPAASSLFGGCCSNSSVSSWP